MASLYNSTAKVYRTSFVTDSFGQQVQSESILYDTLPVNVSRKEKVPMSTNNGALDDFSDEVRIYTKRPCQDIKRGDRVITEGVTYKITKITPRRDFNRSTNHVEFLCQEMV